MLSRNILLFVVVLFLSLVGIAFVTQLDGQVFSNSLGGITFIIGGCGICIRQTANREQSQPFRWFWAMVAFTLLVVIGIITAQLPMSYKFQKRFNDNSEKTYRNVQKKIEEMKNEP